MARGLSPQVPGALGILGGVGKGTPGRVFRFGGLVYRAIAICGSDWPGPLLPVGAWIRMRVTVPPVVRLMVPWRT
jgi:hypothetical protein